MNNKFNLVAPNGNVDSDTDYTINIYGVLPGC